MLNTAEIIAGEACGTVAFLGVAIGYPWLWLHYASTGVLKLSRPPQPRSAVPESSAVAAAAPEVPAATAGPTPVPEQAAAA